MHRVCDSDATACACPSERSFTRAPLGPSGSERASERASEQASEEEEAARRRGERGRKKNLEEEEGGGGGFFPPDLAKLLHFSRRFRDGVLATRVKPIVLRGEKSKYFRGRRKGEGEREREKEGDPELEPRTLHFDRV